MKPVSSTEEVPAGVGADSHVPATDDLVVTAGQLPLTSGGNALPKNVDVAIQAVASR